MFVETEVEFRVLTSALDGSEGSNSRPDCYSHHPPSTQLLYVGFCKRLSISYEALKIQGLIM
jgi:hypothetical protein